MITSKALFSSFIIEYRRIDFDDIRTINVLATSMKEAIKTLVEIEGNRTIVFRVRKELF
jgi:hypothetical protein